MIRGKNSGNQGTVRADVQLNEPISSRVDDSEVDGTELNRLAERLRSIQVKRLIYFLQINYQASEIYSGLWLSLFILIMHLIGVHG